MLVALIPSTRIVAGPDGKFYQINDFKHGQEDGLDKDGGAAFSGSLAADAKAAGFDPSNFNTAECTKRHQCYWWWC